MTTKPIAVWCCVDPQGEPITWSYGHEAGVSVRRFMDQFHVNYDEWKELKKQGYRCKRFILSEGEGEA